MRDNAHEGLGQPQVPWLDVAFGEREIIDQRHHRGRLIGHVAHQHGHRVQPGQRRRPHPALAGDDLVAPVTHRAHQHGLHHALAADALGQLVKRPLVHAGPRLVAAGAEPGQLEPGRCIVRRLLADDLGPEQRLETQAEAFLPGCHAGIVAASVAPRLGAAPGRAPRHGGRPALA